MVLWTLCPLEELLHSWLLALRGERKSPNTVRAYETGVRSFLAFCTEPGPAGRTSPR